MKDIEDFQTSEKKFAEIILAVSRKMVWSRLAD